MDLLQAPLIDIQNMYGIVPLGNVWPPGHVFPTDHIYLSLVKSNANDWDSAPLEMPLYAPADGYIIALGVQEHLYADPPYSDYDFTFSPCSEFKLRLGHVTTLSSKILAGLEEPDDCDEYIAGQTLRRYCWRNLDPQDAIRVEAGELLGTAGGRQGQNMLDVTAIDYRSAPLVFVGDRFWEEYYHIVCPLDYYIEPLQSEWKALLGSYKGERRTIEPLCGQIDYDLAGTARGIWFINAERSPEDPHLALVYDNVDPTLGVLSIGVSFGESLPSTKYLFEPRETGWINRRFEEIRVDGEIYCFEGFRDGRESKPAGRILLIQLIDGIHLRAEALPQEQCGLGPWSFSESALTFAR